MHLMQVICDTSDENDIYIDQLLVDEKLAVRCAKSSDSKKLLAGLVTEMELVKGLSARMRAIQV